VLRTEAKMRVLIVLRGGRHDRCAFIGYEEHMGGHMPEAIQFNEIRVAVAGWNGTNPVKITNRLKSET
jgi:hypothetical protein